MGSKGVDFLSCLSCSSTVVAAEGPYRLSSPSLVRCYNPEHMRWLLALAAIAAPLTAADLSSVGPVYFWPMNGALDQYVAEQATSEGLFPVTVDPARAKTVMTDHIDAKFFEGMSEVFAPPAAPEAEEAAEPTSGSIESGLAAHRPPNRPRGNPQGTVFLVDVQTRQVLWSAYIGDFDRRPKSLHREAKPGGERVAQGFTDRIAELLQLTASCWSRRIGP